MDNSRILAYSATFGKILSLLLVALTSCSESPEKSEPSTGKKSLEDSVIRYNNQIVISESQEIDDFILRYQWVMHKTQTGLRYMIYQQGKGPAASQGDIVTIRYSVNLLNGDKVYTTDSSAGFSFEAGKRNVVSGLEEGIMLMNKGSRAKLIVPSHLVPVGVVIILIFAVRAVRGLALVRVWAVSFPAYQGDLRQNP